MPSELEDMQSQIDYLNAQVNQMIIKKPGFAVGSYSNILLNGGGTTTLSAAITSLTATSITVASASGFVVGDSFIIDNEIFLVTAVSGTTLTVGRAQMMTKAATHANGAVVDNTLLPVTFTLPSNLSPRIVQVDATMVNSTTTIGICRGTFLVPDAQNDFKGNMVYNTALLVSGTGSAPVGGVLTTLSAAITTTYGTSISIASGSGIVNGQFLQIDTEVFKVLSGGGGTTLTVARGQFTSKAATHLISADVYNSPTGWVTWFNNAGNGYKAFMTATPGFLYWLGSQINLGLSGYLNITITIFS